MGLGQQLGGHMQQQNFTRSSGIFEGLAPDEDPLKDSTTENKVTPNISPSPLLRQESNASNKSGGTTNEIDRLRAEFHSRRIELIRQKNHQTVLSRQNCTGSGGVAVLPQICPEGEAVTAGDSVPNTVSTAPAVASEASVLGVVSNKNSNIGDSASGGGGVFSSLSIPDSIEIDSSIFDRSVAMAVGAGCSGVKSTGQTMEDDANEKISPQVNAAPLEGDATSSLSESGGSGRVAGGARPTNSMDPVNEGTDRGSGDGDKEDKIVSSVTDTASEPLGREGSQDASSEQTGDVLSSNVTPISRSASAPAGAHVPGTSSTSGLSADNSDKGVDPAKGLAVVAPYSSQDSADASRKKWQCDADLPQRRRVIRLVAELLSARKANPSAKWISELPYKARKLEEQLYKTAPSLEAYVNKRTLKERLKKVATAITCQFKQAKQRSLLKRTPSSELSFGSLPQTSHSRTSTRAPLLSGAPNAPPPQFVTPVHAPSPEEVRKGTGSSSASGPTSVVSCSAAGSALGISTAKQLEQQQQFSQNLQQQILLNIRAQQQLLMKMQKQGTVDKAQEPPALLGGGMGEFKGTMVSGALLGAHGLDGSLVGRDTGPPNSNLFPQIPLSKPPLKRSMTDSSLPHNSGLIMGGARGGRGLAGGMAADSSALTSSPLLPLGVQPQMNLLGQQQQRTETPPNPQQQLHQIQQMRQHLLKQQQISGLAGSLSNNISSAPGMMGTANVGPIGINASIHNSTVSSEMRSQVIVASDANKNNGIEVGISGSKSDSGSSSDQQRSGSSNDNVLMMGAETFEW